MSLVLFLCLLAWTAGTARLWRWAGVGRGVSRAHAACFVMALVTLALALLSPMDTLAESRVSLHMVQHLLLVALAAPLLVLGDPGVSLLWLLPRAARRRLGAWGMPLVAWLRATRGAPVTVWFLHTLTMWAWHLPAPYLAALHHPAVHAIEHLSFLLTAALLWWVALRPGRGQSPRYATSVALMLATSFQGAALGAVLFFSRSAWYVASVPAALKDQQLAGLIMWLPGGMVYLAAAAWFALRWMRMSLTVTRPALAGAVAIIAVLSACRDGSPAVTVAGGDPARGREALAGFGCGSCHEIGGVVAAHGTVGPALDGLARRSLIAGSLSNTADNLVRWIRDPQAIDPETAMPDLHVSVATARDMAAYLYTLR